MNCRIGLWVGICRAVIEEGGGVGKEDEIEWERTF